MNNKNKIKIRILSIVAIVFLCTATVVKSLQNDIFYMIKLGSDILKNGIDLMDHYSFIEGLPYTYPHWLYDIYIYLVYDNFSYFGVYIISIIFFIILIMCIYFVHIRVNKNDFLAFFISIISISCLYVFATARSQIVTVILLFLEVYFIENLINSGKKRYVLFLILISLLIANIHATIWVFTFILYLPFIVTYIIKKIINIKNFKKKINISKKLIIDDILNIKLVFISFIGSFLMGLFSPSRICYTYVFKIMMGNSQDYIMEHASLVVIDHPCFIVFCLILLLILIFSNTKIYLKELFMISGLILMSLVSIRHLIFFYTIGLLYITIIVMRYLDNGKDRSLEILEQLIVTKKLIYICIYVLIFSGFIYKFSENYITDYVPCSLYPVEAVDYIKKLDYKEMRIYNHYNYGSYLLFNDIPVFIDSRCDLYLLEFNGRDYSIFEDSMNIVDDYENIFEFYDISHVLLDNNNILYKILIHNDDYKVIYEDAFFALFERISYEKKKI